MTGGSSSATFRPLAGIRVLDFTALPPGGYCTVQLADLGAEVVRVEPPKLTGKDSLVIGSQALSRAKKSLTLDMRSPRSTDVLKRLISSFDVVVENAAPGSMEERGFGYVQARAANPGVIWCAITGFGQDGPYASHAGHDLSYVGQSGLLAALSPQLPWHPGTMLSVPLGAMQAVTGIVTALFARTQTGQGAFLDISLAEASTWILSGFGAALKDGFTGIAASPDRRLYPCSDGRFISLAAAEPRTWGALCEGIGRPDLSDRLGVKGEAADAVVAELTAIFMTRPAGHWVEKLGPTGAAVNPVNAGADIIADPQIIGRGGVRELNGEPVPANPIRMAASDGAVTGTDLTPPGKVGDYSETLLAGAGFGVDEIAAMRAEGLI